MEHAITVTAHVQVRPGKEAEAEEVLRGLVSPTRAEPGCLGYELFAMDAKPGRYLFIEAWESPGHLDRHLQQPHVRAFISRSAELLSEPLNVSVWKSISGA